MLNMEEELDLDFQDSIGLRRNMFICHNEGVEYMDQVKMKRMRWDKGELQRRFGFGHDRDAESIPEATVTMSPALRNVDILENIAIYLSSEDLLSCRLVCKHWSVEMATFLFKRKNLIVSDEECLQNKAEALLKKRSEGHPISLSKLSLFNIDAACDLYRKLFSVFGLTLSSVNLEDCNLSPSDLNRMLLVDAPNIAYLHVREGKKKPKPKSSTFKEMKLCNNNQLLLPKLKVLHWDEEHGNTDLKDLIQAFPNLVNLELRNFAVPRSSLFRNLHWDSLTNLFLSPRKDLTDEHCKALTHLKLKLTKLTLFGINAGDRSYLKSLNKFLATLADTLETLELWLDYATLLSVPRSVNFSPLPVHLPKVKRLLTESEIVGHINHLTKFPALKELEIVSNTFEDQHWHDLTKRATIQNQSNLQSFRCGDIDNNSLNKVMRAFPCITTLHLYATYVNDIFLRSIIKNLPNLVDLTIDPCMKAPVLRLTDSAITGVPMDFCRKLNRNPKQFEDVDLSTVKTKPGISDLKLLQILNFSLQNSEISDASVLLSISTLSNLSVLKLPLCKVTDASLSVIEGRLPRLAVLGLAGCQNVTDTAVDNLKRKRSSLLIQTELLPSLENLIRP